MSWRAAHSGHMRVTFPRLADHQKGYSVVERDDGVVYRMDGFTTWGLTCRTTSGT